MSGCRSPTRTATRRIPSPALPGSCSTSSTTTPRRPARSSGSCGGRRPKAKPKLSRSATPPCPSSCGPGSRPGSRRLRPAASRSGPPQPGNPPSGCRLYPPARRNAPAGGFFGSMPGCYRSVTDVAYVSRGMTTLPIDPLATPGAVEAPSPRPGRRTLRGANVGDRLYRGALTALALVLPLLLLTLLAELLAAIPSVVYGLWGVFVLIPFLRTWVVPPLRATLGWTPLFSGVFYGSSLLAGAIILAIMIVTYIAAVAREVLLAVPASQREAALGMGATRWEAVWTAVVPYGRAGLIGAVILGLGRALGETVAVTMVIGNRHDIGLSV